MTEDDAAFLAGLPGWTFAFVLVLARVGVGLLATSCVVLLLTSAVAKVQDSADRIH